TGPCYPVAFSEDGRYLAVVDYRENMLVKFAKRLPTRWAEWLCERLPGEASTIIVDLQTGTVWPKLPFTTLCAFADGGSTFLTWDADLTVWDVPPKWLHCTPWAWAAIGAWF